MNLLQGQASVFLKEVGKDTCLFYHLENTTEPALAPLPPSPPPEGYGDKHSTSYLLPTRGLFICGVRRASLPNADA